MKILVFYNSTQTYTNTVFEHINSFAKYSQHELFYCHCDEYQKRISVNLNFFDAVIIHYSIRLPFDQLPGALVKKLTAYNGLKTLFIQDEYNYTHRAWYWIKRLEISLVFTVVPTANIERVYPASEFPGVRFVNNLTGYVPDTLPPTPPIPTSDRLLVVGYRGRSLPLEYGQLGIEKTGIGQLFKWYCMANGIAHDIAWDEDSRIYGSGWYEFMGSCRSMLGSESGSNVFDWDGTLAGDIAIYKKNNPTASEAEVYLEVVKDREIPCLMNQISPRVFESIALRTALVLFRGSYSDVIKPDVHYIPVELDGSNLESVFLKLTDSTYVERMVNRAHEDVIVSGLYSYSSFVRLVDFELELAYARCAPRSRSSGYGISDIFRQKNMLTRVPQHYVQPKITQSPLYRLWRSLSEKQRESLRPFVPKFLKKMN